MKKINGQPTAIFEGEKLSVSLSASLSASLDVSLADRQSAKQSHAILMKERNGQPNAIFERKSCAYHLAYKIYAGHSGGGPPDIWCLRQGGPKLANAQASKPLNNGR